MTPADAAFRDAFWAAPPPLPRGVTILRTEACVMAQSGPPGHAIYDLAEVRLGASSQSVLIGYRTPLHPVDVPAMRDRLHRVDEQIQRRGTSSPPVERVPMIVTDSVSSRALDVCERENVAVLDQRGTLFFYANSTLIKVQGTLPVPSRSQVALFQGKGCRLVRVLLQAPNEPRTIRALSQQTETSHPVAQGVLRRLVLDGYAEPTAGRLGFRLSQPVELLQAWLTSGDRTATVEGFNAPATTPDLLQRAFSQLQAQGVRAVFTLASALLPEERFVSGLPHGLYLSGSIEAAVSAFSLRRITPHNFWILRPEPLAETAAGGIYYAPRQLAHGPGVALPQLCVDTYQSGGRGKEQADELVRRYAQSLVAPPGNTG